jgi:methionyl-tRNA formyltransferase
MGSFQQILKAPLLKRLPPVLNIHPTLLPAYRGPMPPFWIIANGERESGVTLHWVDPGVDTGPVLAREKFAVEPWLTAGEYADRADQVGARLLARVLQGLRPGDVGRGEVQQGEGSYQGVVKPADLVVPFEQPWKVAYDRARAAAPFRSLTLHVPATVWRGETTRGPASKDGEPGTMQLELADAVPVTTHTPLAVGVVERTPERGLYVQCDGGGVLFRKVAVVGTSPLSPRRGEGAVEVKRAAA